MECVHENVGTNLIKAYMSWNIPNQKGNKRLTVGVTIENNNYYDCTIMKNYRFLEPKRTHVVEFVVRRR